MPAPPAAAPPALPPLVERLAHQTVVLAYVLVYVFLAATPIGAGLIAGFLVSPGVGIGAFFASLGLLGGVASYILGRE